MVACPGATIVFLFAALRFRFAFSFAGLPDALDLLIFPCGAWAVPRGSDLTIVLTNHALPRQKIAPQRVRVELEDAPAPLCVTLERIDEHHANAKAAWRAMGCPEYPSAAEISRLEEASRLVGEALGWEYDGRTVRLEVDVPEHAVAAVTVEFTGPGR
jgi:xylan 1,4-beta-xylosidase